MTRLFMKIFLGVLLTVLFTFFVGLQIAFWIMPRPPMFPTPSSHGSRPGEMEGSRSGSMDGPMQGPQRGPRHGSPLERMMDGPDQKDMEDEWRIRMGDLLELHARAAAELAATAGSEAVLEDMDRLGGAWGVQTYLLDESGEDVRGRETPARAKELTERLDQDCAIERGETERYITLAMRFRDGKGRPYVFVAETQMRSPPPKSLFASIAFLRMAPVAIGLGLVCFFLANHITKPVLRMRSALRRFGEGDLQQRVGESIGRRRDEIGELARDFDHMAERIATLLGAQRRLLQDISHELRSPLARQRVALALARQQCEEKAGAALDRAEREAERLDALIGELLTLTRLESDTNDEARGPTDLAELVREVIENAEYEACNEARSVQLAECTPCVVAVVPELIQRAVENVVRNALAYTVDNTVVHVSLETDETHAVIRVRDHGPGAPSAELADIFRPFYRVSHARDRQTGGVGLGLAIVERAVRRHGGEVVAKNHPEGGLLVEIRLPRDA